MLRTASLFRVEQGLVKMKKFSALAILPFLLINSGAQADQNVPTPELHRLGMTIYIENCAICHGATGAGDGVMAAQFAPAPRDFTGGVFKFGTTGLGEFPARADITKIIETGIEGSFGRTMPAFTDFTLSERLALAEVIRQFADITAYGEPIEDIVVPASFDIDRGMELYESLDCSSCHGAAGQGDGVLSAPLKDMSGASISPADLTVGTFKGGRDPQDVFMRLYRGIPGTPMPSFGQNVNVDDLWNLTGAVIALSEN